MLYLELRHHLEKLVVLAPVTFRDKKDFNTHRLLRAIDNNTLLSKLPLSEQAAENEIMLFQEALRALYGSGQRYHPPQLIGSYIPYIFTRSSNLYVVNKGSVQEGTRSIHSFCSRMFSRMTAPCHVSRCSYGQS